MRPRALNGTNKRGSLLGFRDVVDSSWRNLFRGGGETLLSADVIEGILLLQGKEVKDCWSFLETILRPSPTPIALEEIRIQIFVNSRDRRDSAPPRVR